MSSSDQYADSRQELHQYDLGAMGKKDYSELRSCAIGPSHVFVGVTMRLVTRWEGNHYIKSRIFDIAFMHSSALHTFAEESRWLDQFDETRHISFGTIQYNECCLSRCERNYGVPEVTLSQALHRYIESHPGCKLVFVGYKADPVLGTMRRKFPEASSFFSDAIDLAHALPPSRPHDHCAGGRLPLLRALNYYGPFGARGPSRTNSAIKTLALLEGLYNMTKEQAMRISTTLARSHSELPLPVTEMENPPDYYPYTAVLRSSHGLPLPKALDCTPNLETFVRRLKYNALRVGTWGTPEPSPLHDSRAAQRRMYAWACFADKKTLDAFMVSIDHANAPCRLLDAVSLCTPAKEAQWEQKYGVGQ